MRDGDEDVALLARDGHPLLCRRDGIGDGPAFHLRIVLRARCGEAEEAHAYRAVASHDERMDPLDRHAGITHGQVGRQPGKTAAPHQQQHLRLRSRASGSLEFVIAYTEHVVAHAIQRFDLRHAVKLQGPGAAREEIAAVDDRKRVGDLPAQLRDRRRASRQPTDILARRLPLLRYADIIKRLQHPVQIIGMQNSELPLLPRPGSQRQRQHEKEEEFSHGQTSFD